MSSLGALYWDVHRSSLEAGIAPAERVRRDRRVRLVLDEMARTGQTPSTEGLDELHAM